MKTLFISLFCLIVSGIAYSQQNQLTSSEKEKMIEKYKEDAKQQKEEYISNFLETLAIDDFQKQIIKQSIYSYFEEIIKITKLGLKPYERDTLIEHLDGRHFEDVKTIVSEDTMGKIMDAVKGDWDYKADKKKKKKEKRKKNKKN